MLKKLATKRGALALLLVGLVVGVVGAQVALERTRYITTGVFTLAEDDVAQFHVALDDGPRQPATQVLMRIFDHSGAVVARRVVTLSPGQAETLELRGEVGRFRAQAEVFDDSGWRFTDRRIVVASVELFEQRGPGILIYKGGVCAPGENIPAGLD
jgi:hypothetical protein